MNYPLIAIILFYRIENSISGLKTKLRLRRYWVAEDLDIKDIQMFIILK